jgi:hypothetical protein
MITVCQALSKRPDPPKTLVAPVIDWRARDLKVSLTV